MLRIGQVEATATQDGKYTDGSVAGGIAATRLRAAAFNAMQEELAHIVESAGLALDINDMTQVLKAIQKLTLSRANPFADIKSDGAAAISTALTNLGLSDVMDIGDFGLGVKNETKPGGMAALGVTQFDYFNPADNIGPLPWFMVWWVIICYGG
ncbi:phage tail fiber protein [Citrobacter freundii]|nr:phage tail fiber protein [Citrobacter freundii]